MRYRHISKYERKVIEVMRNNGGTLEDVAEEIGRSVSTVSRELRRNGAGGEYEALTAHDMAANRLRAWRRPRRFDDRRLCDHVRKKLREDYSPEQIVGSWPSGTLARVSVQTIYTYLHRDRPGWLMHLRQARSRERWSYWKPRKYQRIRDIKPIRQRPHVAACRGRIGDWESDTVRGSDRHAGIATHVDRRTGYVVLAKLEDRTAKIYNEATLKAFEHQALDLPIHTFTVDHGMEFGKFPDLERGCDASVFFADAHCAWQRGCNENLNGLLRQYFPKDRDFRTITGAELRHAETRLNLRPRKRHNYRSPMDLMKEFFALVT